MEKYYLDLIKKQYKGLRDALITAICYLLEEERQVTTIHYGNETLKHIEPVFDDRGHVNDKETELIFEVWDQDGLETDMTVKLNQTSTDWLINIYEKLSGHIIR